MLKEVRELREHINEIYSMAGLRQGSKPGRLISAVVKAVREDCAKVLYMVEVKPQESTRDTFAAAIRGKK